ncbi:putative receptor-like protein kinase [Camellia lanceoleosa]|uniref:Receptor-like protein kinase n=1 Tax=Camellia lanceoleosa TaxID=1840588 RepID=A0ACC0FJL6_9ERIC|nr:putative receptor-like protein kinase [Camellia lanceoleosa]
MAKTGNKNIQAKLVGVSFDNDDDMVRLDNPISKLTINLKNAEVKRKAGQAQRGQGGQGRKGGHNVAAKVTVKGENDPTFQEQIYQIDRKLEAVKMLDMSSLQTKREFQNELQILGSLRLPFIVSLLGFCTKKTHANALSETLLLVVVKEKRGILFVRKLVELMQPEALALTDYFGNTALHATAVLGNIIEAELIVNKNPDLLNIWNKDGFLPLHLAAMHGKRKMTLFLLSVT